MAEQDALQKINDLTLNLLDIVNEIEEIDHMPAEVILVCLLRVVRIYMDKLNIPLDRMMKAIETAGN